MIHHGVSVVEALGVALLRVTNGVLHKAGIRAVYHCKIKTAGCLTSDGPSKSEERQKSMEGSNRGIAGAASRAISINSDPVTLARFLKKYECEFYCFLSVFSCTFINSGYTFILPGTHLMPMRISMAKLTVHAHADSFLAILTDFRRSCGHVKIFLYWKQAHAVSGTPRGYKFTYCPSVKKSLKLRPEETNRAALPGWQLSMSRHSIKPHGREEGGKTAENLIIGTCYCFAVSFRETLLLHLKASSV